MKWSCATAKIHGIMAMPWFQNHSTWSVKNINYEKTMIAKSKRNHFKIMFADSDLIGFGWYKVMLW